MAQTAALEAAVVAAKAAIDMIRDDAWQKRVLREWLDSEDLLDAYGIGSSCNDPKQLRAWEAVVDAKTQAAADSEAARLARAAEPPSATPQSCADCKATRKTKWRMDPYIHDLTHKEVWKWTCDACHHDSCDSI